MLKRMRWYLWVLAGILLIYLAVSVYFMEHFFMGTVINGESAEFLTVKQVNSLILEQAESYSLTLKERGGTEDTLTAEQLGMSFSETEFLLENPARDASRTLSYEEFHLLMETKDYFIFFLTKHQVTLLCKRDLKEEERDSFSAFIRRKFGTRYRYVNL